jgi:hypothetical protein
MDRVPPELKGVASQRLEPIPQRHFDRSMETGAGGIYTTAEDMLRRNKGLDSPGLLSAQALDYIFTAHPPGNYGAGWFIETSPRRKIYHEGWDPGRHHCARE